MTHPRRIFLMTLAATGAAASLGVNAQPKLLDEKDPTAIALGYVADASKVDKAKYPKYAAGQVCANCALYQGKATDPAAPCTLFAGKLVAGKGWCSAWAKKA